MALVPLTVPDIGDIADAAIIEILVKPGDAIRPEQSLITLESDKASMEVPASQGGVLQSLSVKLGDRVGTGAVIGMLDVAQDAAAAPSAAEPAPAAPIAAEPAIEPAPVPAALKEAEPTEAPPPHVPPTADLPPVGDPQPVTLAHASPSVRHFARVLGVDLLKVKGSGPKGRVTQADVEAFVRQALQQGSTPAAAAPVAGGEGLSLLPWPKVDFAKFGPIERQPLSRIKKISGANLHRNWVRIPHVTNNEEADITELEAFRVKLNEEYAKAGVKFTLLAFLLKACAAALKKFPNFNASLDGDDLVLKQYVHIGFAADTPNGLVVPVVRDVDTKSISQLAQETAALAAKARDGKLTPAEMQGGNFSISSLGGFGGTTFTPIINAPEVAILGVCRSAMKPVWNGSEFVPRLMLPLSLSYDHRVIDGAAAAKFNAYLTALLADFRRALV